MYNDQKVSFESRKNQDITVLNINLTWFCPVRCEYCHITSKASRCDKRILSEENLIQECEVGKQNNISEYRFSGGEPLFLRDKLFEYADIVYKITNKKPTVLTSGIHINKEWLQKAKGKFSGIYISVENPLKPMQAIVNNKNIMQVMKEYNSNEVPLRYGLTLIEALQFKNIEKIFDVLYENVDKKFMPQFEYPCLKNFIQPNKEELNDIYIGTKTLFKKYGIIPYYFVNIIGSPVFLSEEAFRVVVNLNPDGKYDIYESMEEAFDVKYKWLNYSLEKQRDSETCQKCEWIDSCKHHGSSIMYDWCDLRRAILSGIYDGLEVTSNAELKNA